MHILSENYRSEFLACPQLCRLEYAQGSVDFEPALLIKGNTLLLKYIARNVDLRIIFAMIGNRLLYGVEVFDDIDTPGVMWSVLEHVREKKAIDAMLRGQPCQVFLFNEIAINVAWAAVQIPLAQHGPLEDMLNAAVTGRVDHSAIRHDTSAIFDRIHKGDFSSDIIVIDFPIDVDWHPLSSHFITSHASDSMLNLFEKDEGNQQEQICIWLTDNLHPQKVYHSPQIPKGRGFRELTDILLSHDFGSILIESKALTILARAKLPNRSKLSHDISDHINKAINQLRGGMRRLKDGTPVTTTAGNVVEAERSKPMHGIILIPDMGLIQNRGNFGVEVAYEFMKLTGGYLHILDIAELLRVVQAAEMISNKSSTITPMMAFDYYLIERAKKTLEARTLCVQVLLRLDQN